MTKKRLSKAERDAYCAPYHDWQSRLATLRFVQDIPLSPGDPAYDTVSEIEAALPRLQRHPVMICWGLEDFVFDHHFLAVFREAFPSAEVHEFPDCGHYVLEDAEEENHSARKAVPRNMTGSVNIASYLPREAAKQPHAMAIAAPLKGEPMAIWVARW